LRKAGVQVLTIHKGGDIESVRKFAEKYALQLPILHDADEKVVKEWGVLQLPLTLVVDPEGHVAFMAFGGRNWRNPQIARLIMTLLPPL
jgi:peroxiredoxin